MGFASAGQTVRLSDLEGRLIAIRYLGRDVTVTTQYGTSTAPLARVIDLELPSRKGNSLVFQQAVANEIKNQVGSWVVGKLTQQPHPDKEDQTMYLIDSEGVDFEAVAKVFEAIGIDPDAAV